MNSYCTTVGTDLDNLRTRIEQTDLQIRVLETVLAEKRNQLQSDKETRDKYNCPEPNNLAVIATKTLNRYRPPSLKKSKRALIYEGAQYPCIRYYMWLTRLLRIIRENYSPNLWNDVVIQMNSGHRTNLRVAQSLEDLLPSLTADLQRGKTESIGGGWYASKESLDKGRIVILIKKVCEITGLQFGVDVILIE